MSLGLILRKRNIGIAIIIINGVLMLLMAAITRLMLLVPFGLALLGIGLICLPSLLVAIMFGGFYLYFLGLKFAGISPQSSMTLAYIVGVNMLTLLALFVYHYQRRDFPRMINSGMAAAAIFLLYILAQYVLFSVTAGANKKLGFLIVKAVPAFLIGMLLDKRIAARSLKIAAGLAFFLGSYVIASQIPKGVYSLSTGIFGWMYHAHLYTLSSGAIIVISMQLMKRRGSLKSFLMMCIYMLIFAINSIRLPSRGSIISFTAVFIVTIIYFRRELVLKINIQIIQDAIRVLKIKKWRRRRNIKLKPRYILVTILLAAIITAGMYKFGDELYHGIRRIAKISELAAVALSAREADESISSISARASVIEYNYSKYINKPILGVGFGNMSESYTYAHNYFLEVLFETGVVGLMLFIVLFYITGRGAFRIWRQSSRTFDIESRMIIIPVLLWLFSAIAGLASGSLFERTGLWLWMGLILNLARTVKKTRFAVVTGNPEQMLSNP